MEDALAIRKGCVWGGQFTAGVPVRRRCRVVDDVNTVLGARGTGVRPTDPARALAGPDALAGYVETASALKQEVRGRYKAAVARGNVAALSKLTPLLRLLDMTELGVRLYL